MIKSANHVLTIFAVADLARAREFYSLFGWQVTVSVPVYAEYRLPGAMRLGLYERAAYARNLGVDPADIHPRRLGTTELYLYVDDVEAAAARLRAHGARELSPPAERPWGDAAAYFSDPDGNVVVVAKPQ